MKRSGTVLIFVIVWAAVLFASFVIGICVREVRFHRAGAVIETKTDITPKVVNSKVEKLSDAEKLAQELAQKAPAPTPGPGGGERFANRSGGQGTEEGRGNMRGRFGNMSEEERAQMRERFGERRSGGRGEGGRGRPGGRQNREQQ